MLHKQFVEVDALLDVVLGGAWKTTGYRGTKQRQRKNVLPLGECEKLHDNHPMHILYIYTVYALGGDFKRSGDEMWGVEVAKGKSKNQTADTK